jgi:alcohol dehydrogenase class IV
VVLPHAAHYNHRAAPDALARVARALGGTDAAEAGALLFALERTLGLPRSLAELGLPREGVDEAARLATASPYPNPAPVELEPIRALLERAWRGDALA